MSNENHVLAQNKPNYSLSVIKTPRPPASGISLTKAAPPAPFGDCFFYNHVLPLYCCIMLKLHLA
jgi:hypothetical protein